ncbi:hypothetical protein LMG22037_03262 [Paraburkholderia phenoliruptrix]|uniref:Uncharacterized protein n=1 Tax=Paraburkholderia phenoliruptrix TaxID=252970 RepID=A0A6J5BAE5_9BURK|nr:hypothetical protein LMG22037_03262 [Paraburkholderia phenoliruptrix]
MLPASHCVLAGRVGPNTACSRLARGGYRLRLGAEAKDKAARGGGRTGVALAEERSG